MEKVYATVLREVTGTGTEVDWFELFQLYRNKLAHIGNYMFPTIGLPAKGSEASYAFLPNHWPVLIEQHFSTGKPGKPIDFAKFVEAEYVHQDLVEYAERLITRVRNAISNLFTVLLESYRLFSDFDPDAKAIETLKEQHRSWRFRRFDDPPA